MSPTNVRPLLRLAGRLIKLESTRPDYRRHRAPGGTPRFTVNRLERHPGDRSVYRRSANRGAEYNGVRHDIVSNAGAVAPADEPPWPASPPAQQRHPQPAPAYHPAWQQPPDELCCGGMINCFAMPWWQRPSRRARDPCLCVDDPTCPSVGDAGLGQRRVASKGVGKIRRGRVYKGHRTESRFKVTANQPNPLLVLTP